MSEKINAKTYIGVLKEFNKLPEDIKKYFSDAPSLIENYSFEVVIAYLYLKIEQAQNRILYGGVVKRHKADKDVASKIINSHHLTRDGFKLLYKNIFKEELSKEIIKQLEFAEKIRDQTIHGKKVSDKDLRQAIIDCFKYAELINNEVYNSAEFKPLGDMRGFKGRADVLSKETTRWLLKGLGFCPPNNKSKDTK